MVHRLKIVAVVLSLAVLSQTALGLGLGEVSLDSKLNQPLDARIDLLEIRDLEKSEILIGLASAEDFERVGVDRPYFLTDLKFEVNVDSSQNASVRITSTKLVREPFLNFIVEAQWPSGKILREYTLLLDLPVFSEQQAPAVNPSSSVASRQVPQSQSTANIPSRTSNSRSSFDQGRSQQGSQSQGGSRTSLYSGGDVTEAVQADQTLWEIALDVRPNNSYSVQQTMLAIQQLNPDAFINNNINLLKKGQVLRVPSAEQIRNIGKQDAVSSVAAQNSDWSGDSSELGAQLSAQDAPQAQQRDESAAAGRLKLVSPDSPSESNAGKSSGSGDSQSEAIENELAVTLEELERSNRDNSDLRSKVQSLEEQIETLESLVEVTSEEMRALELSASKNQQAKNDEILAPPVSDDSVGVADLYDTAQEPDAPAVDDTTADPSLDLSDLSEPVLELGDNQPQADIAEPEAVEPEIVEPEMVEPAETAEVVEEAKPAPVVISKRQSSKSFIDYIMDYIIYIAIGLIVLIGAAVYWFQSRDRYDDEDDEEDFLTQDDEFVSPEFDESDAAIIEDDDATVIQDRGDAVSEVVDEEQTTEAQTADAASESEIYISLGQYEQAEEILVNALDHDESNHVARLKLLEVYGAQNQAEKFDEHFAKIYADGDAESIGRAQTLRSSIDGIGEFQPLSDGESVANELSESLSLDEPVNEDDGGFSLDLDTESSELSADDLSLDFDLGLDEDDSLDASAEPINEESVKPDVAQDDNLSLDLGDDLNLDVNDEEISAASSAMLDDEILLELEDDSLEGSASLTESLTESQTIESPIVTADDLSGVDDLSEELIEDDISKDTESIDFDLGLDDIDISEPGDSKDVNLEDDIAALDAELDGLEDKAPQAPPIADMEEFASDVDLSNYSALDDSDDGTLLDDEFESFDADQETASLPASQEIKDNAPKSEALTDNDDLSELDAAEASLADLDSELDALELDLEELSEGDTDSPEEEAVAEMEEPVTDFDEFDDLDDLGSDQADSVELESAELESEDDEVQAMGDDTLFTQAISEVPSDGDELDMEMSSEDDEDDDLGFLNDSDEIATKLDLARAYIDMGDREGAKDIIDEIQKEGSAQQKDEADKLLARLED